MSEQRTETAQRVIAETLCPPSHREGMVVSIVGKPMVSGPRRVCVMHSVMAQNVAKALTEAGILPGAAPERVCDHPGLDHDEHWAYCWPCPKCGVCKFIGHGPLCESCYMSTPAAGEVAP